MNPSPTTIKVSRDAPAAGAPTAERTHVVAAAHSSSAGRTLLGCGTVAGPLWVVVALVEAQTRHGFSLSRNPVSLLELGSWGWVQQVSFIVTGTLLTAGAVGLRSTRNGESGRAWVPRLLATVGTGTAAAGIFHPDPNNGFPPGTPLGATKVVSWHGTLHLLVSNVAFVAILALCVVIGRRAARDGQDRLRIASYLVLVICGASVAITAAGSKNGIPLYVGISLGLLWASGACLRALAPTQSST